MSASAYRARRTQSPSARVLRDEYLHSKIVRVHEESGGVYGQLNIWDGLWGEGVDAARCRRPRAP
ncbi:MAG: hypothetical protein AAGU73_05095 [Actinomycetota bacterium]